MGQTFIGDVNGLGNNTIIQVDEGNSEITLSATGTVQLNSSSVVSLNASPGGDINIFTQGEIKIGNISGSGNLLTINTTNVTLKTTNGFELLDSTIQYPQAYNTTSRTGANALAQTDDYIQTFFATGLTATLPLVDADNVGITFFITNVFNGNLTVNTQGSPAQNIWSSIGTMPATSMTLARGHSHIFTAIKTGTISYGWSMV
jgi:hypothetical protein